MTFRPIKTATPLEKLRFLVGAACDRRLTAAENAVLAVIADGTNAQTGDYWISMGTLAKKTGFGRRHVARAIDRLCELGLLEITEKGDARRQRANHYAVEFDAYVPSDSLVTQESLPSDMQDTSLVTQESLPSDMQDTSLVTQESLPSVLQSTLIRSLIRGFTHG